MISVTILTKDSKQHITEVLDALTSFDEVLIFDTGSTDSTLSIAKKYPNVTIHHGELDGFGPTHNRAAALAKHDWILSIDSDEVVTEEMRKEIEALPFNTTSVYTFPRYNYYGGKWIKGCGWYPDRQKRLYHRKHTGWCDSFVHESVQTHNCQIVPVQAGMKHYSYTTTSDFLKKMESYSTLFAEQNKKKKRVTLATAIGHSLFTFIKSYFLKMGFLCGVEGFIISIYNANTAFYKYLKTRELQKKKCV